MKNLITIKRLLAAAILLTSAVFLASTICADEKQPAPTSTFPDEDERGIRTIIMSVENAWNTHDMQAYSKLLTDDADWINIVGMHWKGKVAVMKAHTVFHEITFKVQNHKIKTDNIEVRPLSSNIALAVVTTTNDAFTSPDGRIFSKAQNRQTYVLVKEADGWKITHGHNVRVDEVATKHDPVNRPK